MCSSMERNLFWTRTKTALIPKNISFTTVQTNLLVSLVELQVVNYTITPKQPAL